MTRGGAGGERPVEEGLQQPETGSQEQSWLQMQSTHTGVGARG